MSGIYIPDLKMPTGCASCKIKRRNGGRMVCPLCLEEWDIHDPMSADHRLDNCPLIPVPEHGRLIDADALAHDLDFDVENDQRALDEMNLVGKEREHLQSDKDCKQNCMWYLSEAPTIIPADKEGEI